MPRTRIDDTMNVEITFSAGEPTTFSMAWNEELSDGSDTMNRRRFEPYSFSDLPPGAATSLANLLAHMKTHRDNEHPINPQGA